MNSDELKTRDDNASGSETTSAHDVGELDQPLVIDSGEELSGQEDLDERLAEPVLKGTAGIEAAQTMIAAFLIAAIALLAYSNAFRLPFHFEDQQAIVVNTATHTVAMSPLGGIPSGIPMLPALTFGLNWWLSPGSPGGFHGVNILLHALNGVLMYLLARRLLRVNTTAEAAQGGFQVSEPIAMLAGLMLALHPLATESVNYIVGRPELLCTGFTLASVVFFLRGATREGSPSIGTLILSAVCFGLAWASGTFAMLVPALILAADWIVNGSAMTKRIAVHAAFWGIAIALGAWWYTVTNLNQNPYDVMSPPAPTLPGAKALAFNRGLGLSFNPTFLSVDHDLPPAMGIIDPEEPGVNPVLAMSTGVGLGLIGLILILARSPLGLAITWLMLALAPVSFFIPPFTRFTERSLYFGLCGIALILAWTVSKVIGKRLPAIVAGVSVVVLLIAAGTGTFVRNGIWAEPLTLWQDAIGKAPAAPEPFIRVGAIHYNNGQQAYAQWFTLERQGERAGAAGMKEEYEREFSNAESYLRQAVELKPEDARLRNSLGITLNYTGKREEAINQLTEALRLDPSLVQCTVQLGSIYDSLAAESASQHYRQRALDYFRRAERLGGMKPEEYVAYAAALTRAGDILGAARQLNIAAQGDESSPAAARLKQLLPGIEAMRTAQQQARAAETAEPTPPDAVRLRAAAMLADGQLLQAFYLLERYIKQYPADFNAWLMMGVVRARVGEADAFVREHPVPPAVAEGGSLPWLQLARECAAISRWDSARTYLKFAETLSEEYRQPLVRLAEFANELNQPSVASAILADAAKETPEDPAPWLMLCDIALASNNLPQARGYLDEAERLGADPVAVAPRREKAGETPEEEKQKPRTVLE